MGDRASDYETYRKEEEAKGNVPDPDWLWGDAEHKTWLSKRQAGGQAGEMTKREARQKTYSEKGQEIKGSILRRKQALKEARE